jgi:NAD(P)H-hydrate epimerase
LLAACLAVYWHGLGGERLAAAYPRRGNLASEIADMLPRAITE